MKIGLISDTHGMLDPRVYDYFRTCDEIWHAGDVGDLKIIDDLAASKPLRAVFGNIDDREIRTRLPEDLFFECGGLTVWMTHIGGSPPRYNKRVVPILNERNPDIFVCGHSHLLKVARDPSRNGMFYINPGAAGHHGFHHMRTVMRLEVASGEVSNLEVIELGKRGALPA